MSPKVIAAILDESEDKIKALIERLENNKIILGYNTIINWERFGEDGVTAMIDVKVAPEREVGFEKVAERICRFPEVRCVYLMSGTYDLFCSGNGRNHERYCLVCFSPALNFGAGAKHSYSFCT